MICSEKWRVNRFDYHAGTLSNYGSAFQVQVTAYLDEFGGEVPLEESTPFTFATTRRSKRGSGKWGTPFLLRGRKGIFARLMGVGWVRADGYFVLLSFDSSAMVALSS